MVIAPRHVAIFCLNMAQGLPGSFFAIGLPALLRQAGEGLDTVALAYLIWAPWALKFLWGPLLDRRRGWFAAIFGRPALLPAMMAGCFLLLLPFPPEQIGWPVFAIGTLSAFLGATLQMTLARWIIEAEPDERRRAPLNALQVAGMITGAMIGGTLMVFLAEYVSWRFAVMTVAALIALTPLPFLLQRRTVQAATQKNTRRNLLRNPLPLLALMLVSDIATGTDVLLTARLIDAGNGAVMATFLLNTLALAITVPATWAGARLLQSQPVGRAMALMLGGKFLLLLGLSAPGMGAAGVVFLAVASVVVSSVIAIGYWQLYMRHVRSGHAATGVGLLTSIRVGLIMVGGIGGGQLAARLGYGPVFLGAAGLMLIAVLLVMRIKEPAPCGCTA